jgi:16S rRNA (cytosine1402-N4)-methyltransferase
LILERLGPAGRLLALDRDPSAVALTQQRFQGDDRVKAVRANYADLAAAAGDPGWTAADGILIDAGVSSMQIDQPQRGFSFQNPGPLDLRMDPSSGPTAAEYLATVPVDELEAALRRLGDVGPAGRIAKELKRRAAAGQLKTTDDLAEAVTRALPFVKGMPAEVRTVFQAVRMAVNRELEHLETALEAGIDFLAPGGRFVVISFHSGEDRVVKNAFRDAGRRQRETSPEGRVISERPPTLKVLTKKPLRPGAGEVAANPRAHSARLRAAQRLED